MCDFAHFLMSNVECLTAGRQGAPRSITSACRPSLTVRVCVCVCCVQATHALINRTFSHRKSELCFTPRMSEAAPPNRRKVQPSTALETPSTFFSSGWWTARYYGLIFLFSRYWIQTYFWMTAAQIQKWTTLYGRALSSERKYVHVFPKWHPSDKCGTRNFAKRGFPAFSEAPLATSPDLTT